ncbi:MAG: signal peptide peptidase SppA [Planctomycetota bacterium]|jgi:protease-4
MDFDNENNFSETPEPQFSGSTPPPKPQVPVFIEKPKKKSRWRIFWGIFIGLSVLANMILLMMLVLVSIAAAFGMGQYDGFMEKIIQDGPPTSKIVVINLVGLIDEKQSDSIRRQLKIAYEDNNIKGLLIRVNSPGGMVSSSDQIYNEILKYREETKLPVVSFMQGVAASGGYYASVACDEIVAEPTIITGSIGVIMGYFVFNDLLENKLGIQPVIIKSGRKKDWPSYFRAPSDEELQYIEDKIIKPSYERFVEIVANGRESLTFTEAKRLADGSIYGADEALQEKLIDDIGYLQQAIDHIKSLAGIKDAMVVEYKKTLSFYDVIGSSQDNILHIDKAKIYEYNTPDVLYLWSGY